MNVRSNNELSSESLFSFKVLVNKVKCPYSIITFVLEFGSFFCSKIRDTTVYEIIILFCYCIVFPFHCPLLVLRDSNSINTYRRVKDHWRSSLKKRRARRMKTTSMEKFREL